MAEYCVTWSIDITADNPTKAALEAETIQYEQIIMCQNAGVFEVVDKDTLENTSVDLQKYYEDKN